MSNPNSINNKKANKKRYRHYEAEQEYLNIYNDDSTKKRVEGIEDFLDEDEDNDEDDSYTKNENFAIQDAQLMSEAEGCNGYSEEGRDSQDEFNAEENPNLAGNRSLDVEKLAYAYTSDIPKIAANVISSINEGNSGINFLHENKEGLNILQQDKVEQQEFYEKNTGIILHLSDLHFTQYTDEEDELYLLIKDLKKIYSIENEKLNLDNIDYIVVSGDLSSSADNEGLKKACNFIVELAKKCGIRDISKNVILVPGNQDLSWKVTMKSYEVMQGKSENYLDKEINKDFYLKRNMEIWKEKFNDFSALTYEKIYGEVFKKEAKDQLKVIKGEFIKKFKIAFFMLNTAENMDQFNKDNTYFDLENLVKASKYIPGDDYIKIAVGHHPLNIMSGDGDDIKFGNMLQSEDFRLYMHGHMHRDISLSYINSQNLNSDMLMVGAGTVDGNEDGLSSYSGQRYNIITINKVEGNDKLKMRIYTRERENFGTYWRPANIYYNKPLRGYTSSLEVNQET